MIFFGSDQDNSYPKNSKANSKRYVTFCQNMTEASSGNINSINSYRTLPEKYTVYMVFQTERFNARMYFCTFYKVVQATC